MAQSRRPGRIEQRAAVAELRREGRGATSRARRLERQIVKQEAEIARAGRIFKRAYVARLRDQLRDLQRQQRVEERAAKRSQTALGHFLTTPSKRTTYQRRVVSRITRQVQRGEAPLTRGSKDRLRPIDLTYAEKLKGYRGRADPANPAATIENPDELYLSLPRDLRDSKLGEAAFLHQEWLDNEMQTLGREFDPLLAYH